MSDQQQANPEAQPVSPSSSSPRPVARQRARSGDEVLPTRSSDEYDRGWGDERSDRDDDWYQRERPPHHE